MAEERLIDEDKDRKYRIRKNENGEEELVVIDPEEDEEDEFPVYGVVTDEDGELTKEQVEEKNAERQRNMQRKAEQLKAEGIAKLEAGDFEGAQYALNQASELTEYDGELYYLKLKAYTRNMTDFFDLRQCVEAAEGVAEYTGEEQKKELLETSAPLKERIAVFESKCASLSEENEAGKAERRETFKKAYKNSLILLACSMAPFVVFCILAIVFGSMLYSDKNGQFIVLTIIFAALSVATLIVNLFTFRKFIDASRKVKLNESDSSTRVGREYTACAEELENLKKIYSSFSNDLS